MDNSTTENLEKIAMSKLYNDSMPDDIEINNKDKTNDNFSDSYLRISIYIKSRETIESTKDEYDIESTSSIGEIEVYKDKEWRWKGNFNANIMGIFKKGIILEYPEIILSNQLSNIEKIEMLKKLISEKQMELFSMKNDILNQIILSLVDRFTLNSTFEEWNKLKLYKLFDVSSLPLDEKTEKNIYNYLKDLINKTYYSRNVTELLNYIDLDNISEIIVPIEIAFDLVFTVFECLVGNEKCYFVLNENNEFKEWN